MQGMKTGRILRQAVCTAAVLGLAFSAQAQNTSGDEADLDRFDRAVREGNVPETRPSGQLDEPYGKPGRTRTDLGKAATRPSGVRGHPIGPGETGEQKESGWVRIGFDYDDDGRFDSFDYVSSEEADRLRAAGARGTERGDQTWREERRTILRERAMTRGDQEERRGAEGRWRERAESMAARRGWRQHERIEGRVLSVTPMNVYDEEHLVLNLETSDNRQIQVDLGRRDRLAEALNRLREGARISVMGRRSPFRERPLVIAHRVQHDGEWINIDVDFEPFARAGQGPLREMGGQQYSGEVVSTREAWFSGHDHAHLLASVRLEGQDSTLVVDLGPAQHLSDHTFRNGDQISFVARNGCINGQQALIADELTTADGQYVMLENYEAQGPLQLGDESFRGRLRGRPVGPEGEYEGRPLERERERFRERSDRPDQYREKESIEQRRYQQRSYRDDMKEGMKERMRREDYDQPGSRIDQQNRGLRGLNGEREIESGTPQYETEPETNQ